MNQDAKDLFEEIKTEIDANPKPSRFYTPDEIRVFFEYANPETLADNPRFWEIYHAVSCPRRTLAFVTVKKVGKQWTVAFSQSWFDSWKLFEFAPKESTEPEEHSF